MPFPEWDRARKHPFRHIDLEGFVTELHQVFAGSSLCTAQSDRHPGDSVPLESFFRALHWACASSNFNLDQMKVISDDPPIGPIACTFFDPPGATHLSKRIVVAANLEEYYELCVDAVWLKQFLKRFGIDAADFYKHCNSKLGNP